MTQDVDTEVRQKEAPVAAEPPAPRRHRFATALALVVGAVACVGGGAVAGALWGPSLVRAYLPEVAAEIPALRPPDPVLETLEDGYDGELVRRVAAVGAELGRSAYTVPSLDEATAGALQGLLATADAHALYMGPDEYARAVEIEDAEADAAPLVTGALLEDTGVIAVARLTPGVADAVAQQLESLRAQGAQAFVLDLRGNPGGSLNEAVAVASLFLEGGTVAEVIHADGTTDRIAADAAAHGASEPLVLLVAGDTGSAAEALAAALQDHRRALLVGTVTAGRGGVQVVKTLSFGGAVAYAVSAFRTPDGYVVDGRGVAPDLVLPLDETLRCGDAATDSQLAAALELVRAWRAAGTLDVEGLSNPPGPQADGVDQARALERSMGEAAVGLDEPPEPPVDGDGAEVDAIAGPEATSDLADDDRQSLSRK